MLKSNQRPAPPEDRVGIIVDKLPRCDPAAAERLAGRLEELGYNVQRLTVAEFSAATRKVQGGIECAVLIVTQAVSFPADAAGDLQTYAERGGQLLILGGPLFNSLVKLVDGQYRECDYGRNCLDATFSGAMPPVLLEGFAPTYKVYALQGQTRFLAEPGQFVFNGAVGSNLPLDVICPAPRPHGQGYGQRRKTRYLPVLECRGEGGRAGGRRGAAAFFMLNDTFNFPFSLGGTRPNSVGAAITGSATAGIGFTHPQPLDIPGFEELLAGMLDHLLRGLYLFEGGCTAFVYRAGETPAFGARVLNTRQDYLPVKLRFTLSAPGEPAVEQEVDLLAGPRNISDCRCPCPAALRPGLTYRVEVTLHFDGAPVDAIEHETMLLAPRRPAADDFIRVEGDNFMLKGKPWYPVGMNYWPLFFAGVEEIENWYGWLTDKYYDQVEVERDLELMEQCGINFVITRLDGNIFDHSIPHLLDFLERCRRHGIRVGLGWPEGMSPFYYSPEAVRKFFEVTGIQDDPTVICYDMIWELGGCPLLDKYRGYWDAPWRAWIAERYGSIENAERDWGVPANRDAGGAVIAPDNGHWNKDGPWRVMVAAYRRFMDDYLNQKWSAAVRDIRRHAPRQLLTYRMGHITANNVSCTAACKHVDFLSPEGYDFRLGADGFNAACFTSRLLDFTGNGKPIVWMEFGMSLIGNKYARQLFWNWSALRPFHEKLLEQDALMRQFYEMIVASGCNGLAPWWWGGGPRGRDLGDFGLVEPDGTLRPAAESLVKMVPALTRPRRRPDPETWFEVDRDAHAGGYARICFGAGRDAYAAAAQAGKWLGVRTAGTGTNSANTPLIAVGNTPYNGHNPLKYLNAEFNAVVLSDAAGRTWDVAAGGTVTVPRGALLSLRLSVGNTQEAQWLAPAPKLTEGAVHLVSLSGAGIALRHPIPRDVGRFEDVEIGPIPLGAIDRETTLRLCLEAEGRGRFGGIFEFSIVV